MLQNNKIHTILSALRTCVVPTNTNGEFKNLNAPIYLYEVVQGGNNGRLLWNRYGRIRAS